MKKPWAISDVNYFVLGLMSTNYLRLTKFSSMTDISITGLRA